MNHMNFVSLILGSGLILTAFCSFVLNVVVLYVLYVGDFLRRSNSVYILAFFTIFGAAIQMALTTAYLGPTSILQRDYFAGGKDSLGAKVLSWIFLAVWYLDMFFQPVTAINRFVMVVYPQYSYLFSRQNTAILAVIVFASGFVLAFFSDFVIDCCIAYIAFEYYSYAYRDTRPNYVNEFIDMPVNTSSSAISISIYILIYFFVRRSNRVANLGLSSRKSNDRKLQEIRYALQFAACSVFSLFAWVSFRILPIMIPGDPGWFSLMALAVIIHSSANSIVFLLFNKEVQVQARRKLLGSTESSIFGDTASRSKNQTQSQIYAVSTGQHTVSFANETGEHDAHCA